MKQKLSELCWDPGGAALLCGALAPSHPDAQLTTHLRGCPGASRLRMGNDVAMALVALLWEEGSPGYTWKMRPSLCNNKEEAPPSSILVVKVLAYLPRPPCLCLSSPSTPLRAPHPTLDGAASSQEPLAERLLRTRPRAGNWGQAPQSGMQFELPTAADQSVTREQ